MTPALPPFERFNQFRQYLDIGFHPGGDLLYVTNLTGQYNLWRQPVGRHGERGYARALTDERDRVVRSFSPADDGRSILVAMDPGGTENYQIARVWLDGRGIEPITSNPEVQHDLPGGTFPVAGGELLFADNARVRSDKDVVVRNVRTGAEERPFPTGNLWADPRFDPARKRILALEYRSNARIHTHLLDRKRETLTEILRHDEDAIVAPIAWTRDGRGVLLVNDIGREFRQLELFDLARGRSKVLAAPKAEIEWIQYAPGPGVLAYSQNTDGYSTLFAGRLGGRMARLATPRGAHSYPFWGSSFGIAPDGRAVVATWASGTAPDEILWVPIPRGRPAWATDAMVGGVPGAPIPAPVLVRIPGPGGRKIPAFHYRAKYRPKGRRPAVLSIHGGPEFQERPSWRMSGLYAFLATRGIDVLAPNVRGSTGYGKEYQHEIYHDWGGGELEDFRACAEWLVHRPDLDRERLGVIGGSFGGFATLSCVTRLPEYWKVGVDLFGPSNLVTFVRSVPPSWRRMTAKWVGDPDTEEEFLLARSPITYLDRVRADLLVIQGANDPRVVKAESDQFVERLRSSGRSVEYLVFDNEGHGFMRKENELKALGTAARFLTERLLGPTPAASR
jgi:dipeptidyl aminopeptidase/acylaminoacyl peptidase